MKISILNTYEYKGGAARSAKRLLKAFLSNNIDARMFANIKESDDRYVDTNIGNIRKGLGIVAPYLDRIIFKIYKQSGFFSSGLLGTVNVKKLLNKRNVDVVNIHWVNGGMVNLSDLKNIECPIVFTLHDSWIMTGGCHLPGTCTRHKENCGRCPQLNSSFPYDITRYLFNKKYRDISSIKRVIFVCPSKWLLHQVSNSKLLQGYRFEHIPNPIDTSVYKKHDKNYSRGVLGIDRSKFVIIIGAMSVHMDLNKGYDLFLSSLDIISKENLLVVVYGSDNCDELKKRNIDAIALGVINEDATMTLLYSLADVIVVPSRIENLSNTLIEAMSCELPAVAFDVGGNSEIIDHLQNGYLAEAYNVDDLANGIEWVRGVDNYSTIGQRARDKVVSKFDKQIIYEQYMNIFKSVTR